ncbi:hypothetical protein GJ496_002000 [Pomphorhynchus laevis]|nr:hypothetical protein GJ496_002000 [Pomphorhynchus laevis]
MSIPLPTRQFNGDPSVNNRGDESNSHWQSLSMFQLTYPTIMTEQMKAIRRKALQHAQRKCEDTSSDSNSIKAHDRTCVYENNVGQSMPMTLVETISFNTSDFTDNFLTCPTCLSNFDELVRLPRLLPCSHTICRECLEHIINSNNCDGHYMSDPIPPETIRCPVCREAILMPRGGLDQLPPSYLINRLMDLIKSKKSRDYIPKCTVHSSETLLFCETCDCVFCPQCEQHSNFQCRHQHSVGNNSSICKSDNDLNEDSNNSEHLVVPFSIAIKRVSEIVNYKSNQCTQLLDNAVMAIRQEMERLDVSIQLASDALEKSFDDICSQIEKRKAQLIDSLFKLKEHKMQSLTEQLELVQAERLRLEQNNIKLHRHPDIRKLTDQIQSLNSQVESGHLLAEPRENSFLKFEYRHNQSLNELSQAICQFGRIKVSNTYPPLCTAKVDGSVANVRCSVSVTAMDYNGNVQNVGGDPLTVTVTDPQNRSIDYLMDDSLAGSYNIIFLPENSGRYKIDVKIFNRPIRGSPLSVDISEHNNPLWSTEIRAPIGIIVNSQSHLFVLDNGQKQIVVLESDTGNFVKQLCSDPWITGTTTCFCKIQNGLLCAVDWKLKRFLMISFSETTLEVNLINELSHNCRLLVEPISIGFSTKLVDNIDNVIGQDSDSSKLFLLDVYRQNSGRFEALMRTSIQLRCPVRAITLSKHETELYYSGFDQSLHKCSLFNVQSQRLHTQEDRLQEESVVHEGCYTAIHVDHEGRLLASRCEMRLVPSCIIEVFSAENITKLAHKIDSYSDNLKRPYAIATDQDGHVFCADFTGRSIKKYRYV